jgi:ketosteroid isomerase-like protein
MSGPNIDLMRRWVDVYNARDVEAMVGYFDPTIELHSAFAAIGGGTYYGHSGVYSWHRDMQEAWGSELRIEPERYFDFGDQTLTFHVVRGRGSQSGAEVAMPGALITTWRGGRIASWRSYAHREDALRVLGVTEDELEPIEP